MSDQQFVYPEKISLLEPTLGLQFSWAWNPKLNPRIAFHNLKMPLSGFLAGIAVSRHLLSAQLRSLVDKLP